MKKINFLIFAFAVMATARGQRTSYHFDFGPGNAAKGYTQITKKDSFSQAIGYGFDFRTDTAIYDVLSKYKDALKSDGIASNTAFYFSMLVPEGNYRVTVTMGNVKNGTNTTIKAESRRLMVEKMTTEPGSFKKASFVVNIKNRNINNATKVGLKPAEYDKLDWDDKLTLEFDGATTIAAMDLEKVEDQITVFLAGNSTVVNQDYEPWASWGQMIPCFFKPGVAFANHAESGLALSSFLSSRRLQKILSVAKAGDYLFIEFGHNDQKEKGANDGAWKSYTERLKLFISEAKAKKMIPVVVTSTARRNFGADGKNINNLGDFPEAAKKVATDEGVALIDLNAMSNILYEALGTEPSKKAFVFYAANSFPGQRNELHDNTHFNTYGAYELAKCVVEGIRSNKLGIAKYLVEKLPVFDPSRPDPVDQFYWPQSPRTSPVKPDGN